MQLIAGSGAHARCDRSNRSFRPWRAPLQDRSSARGLGPVQRLGSCGPSTMGDVIDHECQDQAVASQTPLAGLRWHRVGVLGDASNTAHRVPCALVASPGEPLRCNVEPRWCPQDPMWPVGVGSRSVAECCPCSRTSRAVLNQRLATRRWWVTTNHVRAGHPLLSGDGAVSDGARRDVLTRRPVTTKYWAYNQVLVGDTDGVDVDPVQIDADQLDADQTVTDQTGTDQVGGDQVADEPTDGIHFDGVTVRRRGR